MSERLTSRERREIGIGAVAVLILVIVLGTSYADTPAAQQQDSSAYRLLANFPSVDGLAVGDPIYVGGVRVGDVAGLSLTKDYQAKAELRIDEGVELPSDTSAAIQTDGLFGSRFVRLDIGGDPRLLADGDYVRYTQRALLLSRLMELIVAEAKHNTQACAEAKKASQLCTGPER